MESPYKRRRKAAGGADRYGQFRDGHQRSQDVIAGRLIWSVIPVAKSN